MALPRSLIVNPGALLRGRMRVEILVQIDDPHVHRIYCEGERRAVTISEEAAKVPP
ncbi:MULTISPECIES: hypothetical protein [unclassified Pyramidobacter]|uniref:hypothetical protein n=1 Tax=unclassified Pyramidobacter TaxID=2632171 RepID=UPI0013156B8C|nr:hypothetical protein [Pyramidobacter sp. CG50-2]MCI6259980.1 hypothetical protein [Pyramidobacter sp.]